MVETQPLPKLPTSARPCTMGRGRRAGGWSRVGGRWVSEKAPPAAHRQRSPPSAAVTPKRTLRLMRNGAMCNPTKVSAPLQRPSGCPAGWAGGETRNAIATITHTQPRQLKTKLEQKATDERTTQFVSVHNQSCTRTQFSLHARVCVWCEVVGGSRMVETQPLPKLPTSARPCTMGRGRRATQ